MAEQPTPANVFKWLDQHRIVLLVIVIASIAVSMVAGWFIDFPHPLDLILR